MEEEWEATKEVLETAYYKRALQTYAMTEPQAAQLTLAGMGAFYALSGLMEQFVWRSTTNFYDAYKIGSQTQYYKLGDTIRNFGFMGFGGLVLVLHGLGAFDMMVEMTWKMKGLIALAFWGLNMAVTGIKFWDFEEGYKANTGTVAADQAAGDLIMKSVAADSVRDVVLNGWMILISMGSMDSLALQYWNTKSDEDLEDMWKKGEKKVDEKAEELDGDEEEEEE